MKLRIIFQQPPYAAVKEAPDCQTVVIQSPYTIEQESLGAERTITKLDGTKVNYETYHSEMSALINDILSAMAIAQEPYHSIGLEGLKEPVVLEAVCNQLAALPLKYQSPRQLTLKDCLFGDMLPIQAVTRIIHALDNTAHPVELIIDEDSKSLNVHDMHYLASLKNVTVRFAKDHSVAHRPFRDDTILAEPNFPKSLTKDDMALGLNRMPSMKTRLTDSTFYKQTFKTAHATAAEAILKNFFSQRAQQRNDYTCGPATVKMVAEYYDLPKCIFSGEVVAHQGFWHKLVNAQEMEVALASQTNEAEGSEIDAMRNYLVANGVEVLDDNGYSVNEYAAEVIEQHKLQLWDKLKAIVALRVPVILNMQDSYGDGHFEVVIGIESNRIILADPEGALTGKERYEIIGKSDFIKRWQNASKEYHGRFMIASPNPETTNKLTAILADTPYCLNGELKGERFSIK